MTTVTYSHGSMQRPGNLVVLLQSGAASQNLWQPELTNCTLHVSNLALRWCRRLDPLRRLAAHATNHVGMSKGLWCPLVRFGVEGRGQGLGDSRVKGGSPARDDEVTVSLASNRAFASPRPGKRGVRRKRWSHGCDLLQEKSLGPTRRVRRGGFDKSDSRRRNPKAGSRSTKR